MPIYLGPRNTSRKFAVNDSVPRDVRRRRRSVYEMMRRFGTPMLVKHRFNSRDVQDGYVSGDISVAVTTSPVFNDIYEQTRNRDPISHGVGFVSVENSTDEWYDLNGNIIVSTTNPGAGYTPAPRYRGYGPSQLTWIIEPDRAQDFYKATTGGPIFKIQDALAVAPWWPDINDNDMLINVQLTNINGLFPRLTLFPDPALNPSVNSKIYQTFDRFEAKNVNPVSLRGLDRSGRREYTENFGNNFVVGQQFEMNRIPDTDVGYDVDTDR